MRPWLIVALSALALPPLLLAGGFAWFLVGIGAAAPPVPARVDGIVALTGGAERVETALRLLAEGRAEQLLISGVGGPAEFPILAHRAGVNPGLAARVTLGRQASTTRGNAAETASWVRARGVRSLLVVTSAYHMPRALAELSRALPDVQLSPVPVRRQGVALRLLASEYVKYLAVRAGLDVGLLGRAPESGLLAG